MASRADYQVADFSHATPQHVEWFRDVKPILDAYCRKCHAEGNKTGLVIDDALRDQSRVRPLQSRISTLMQKLLEPDPAKRMPKNSAPLSAAQIKTIATWIDLGGPRADAAGLYWQDNLRPTLYVDADTDGIAIGAYDVDSGLASVSAVGSDNTVLQLTQTGDVWRAAGPFRFDSVTVTATDMAGNRIKLTRKLQSSRP